MVPRKRKKQIVREIRDFVKLWKTKCKPDLDLSASCFHWAVLSHAKFKEMGFKSLITAGSMAWPRIDRRQDDGKRPDLHFSYKWDPNSETTLRLIAEDRMPEIHVWVNLPEERVMVDLTTRYLPQQCNRMLGAGHWQAPQPPDFLWCGYEELPWGVHYDPDPSAVEQVVRMIHTVWGI